MTLLNERPHFAGCDYVVKRLAADPGFRYGCTCGEIYRRMVDDAEALAFLKRHPDYTRKERKASEVMA